MEIKYSNRVNQLKPYLFADLDARRDELIARGETVIDLGVGDPDIPTCNTIIKALKRECMNPKTHRYPGYQGTLKFRMAIADYYKHRFQADLDPDQEIISLLGSKEGIFHAPLAFINPGDYALIPDPGYPVYETGVNFAGGNCFVMPLLEENHYLPDFDAIPEDILDKAKIMFLNYPNNPTGADATADFLDKAIEFAERHSILILYDNAYGDLYSGSVRTAPLSILARPGGKAAAIEFNSFSKPFSMTGWRVGFALGSAKAVQGLLRVKKNIDSGVFEAIQIAAVKALTDCELIVNENNDIYTRRKETFSRIVSESNWNIPVTGSTFYLWTKVPEGPPEKDDLYWADLLLTKAHVVAAPGSGFGTYGKGYLRFAMTANIASIEKAAQAIAEVVSQETQQLKEFKAGE
jgi:LL-diaminopimelate aminotransferase